MELLTICWGCKQLLPIDAFPSEGPRCKACLDEASGPATYIRGWFLVEEPGFRGFPDRWKRALGGINSKPGCRYCSGQGYVYRPVKSGWRVQICRCSLEAVCLRLVETYLTAESAIGSPGELRAIQTVNGLTFARKRQEFCADFWMLAKRVAERLDAETDRRFDHHFEMFRRWFIERQSYQDVARALRIPVAEAHARTSFFRELWRTAAAVGLEAVVTEPYGLFPVADYYYLRNDPQNKPARAFEAEQQLAGAA